ncbi:MAG: TAXI family TRAP transporter solute-binding subunit [Actinomycetota bacterium]
MSSTWVFVTKPTRQRLLVGLALLVTVLLASACVREEQVNEGDDAPATQRLSIATGGTGGVYFVYGGGLAEQVTRNLEGVEATAEVTSASVDNMLLIADEASDLAFTLADTAQDAVEGREGFEEPVPAQALARLYTNYTQVVTTTNTGIETIEDLQGRRVSVGSPNSGTEVIALRILEAAGMDADADIDRQQLDVDQSVQAVRDGTIDAFFWSGGLPTGAVTDLSTTDPIFMIPTAEYTNDLVETYGDVYSETDIPADTYDGMNQDVATIGVPNYLVVNEAMDEELAFELTQLLFERQEQLVQVHPEAQNLDSTTAQEVEGVELHPGAQRYYEDSGS